jgi:hypothetical protein
MSTGLVFMSLPSGQTFWLLIILLSSGTSLSYLAEDTFKSGAWPTRYRGRFTAASRIVGLLGYLLIITSIQHSSLQSFVIAIAAVWWLGFLAAGLWSAFSHKAPAGAETP